MFQAFEKRTDDMLTRIWQTKLELTTSSENLILLLTSGNLNLIKVTENRKVTLPVLRKC